MLSAVEIIDLLRLQPLPNEGGYYRETYRSSLQLSRDCFADRYRTDKACATAIYYLIAPDSFSAMHRLPTDEIFHFYLGDPVEMLQLSADGSGKTIVLGSDLRAGQTPQIVVPAGVWQGSRLLPGGSVALLGTTMAPGFDFADYEPGNRGDLIAAYPAWGAWIKRLTCVGA